MTDACTCTKCGEVFILERVDEMFVKDSTVVYIVRSEWCARCRRFVGFTSTGDEEIAVKVEIVFKDAKHNHRCIWAFDGRPFDPDTRTTFEDAA